MTPPSMAATADESPASTETAEPSHEPKMTSGGPLMDHAYDGIREYDNPLPGWWRFIFWASIVFSAGYWVWFHVTDWGASPDKNYKENLAAYAEKKALREAADARDVSEDMLARNATDPQALAKGAEVFAKVRT
jgi:cytochrome c oxidase cbb3-type subunit 3